MKRYRLLGPCLHDGTLLNAGDVLLLDDAAGAQLVLAGAGELESDDVAADDAQPALTDELDEVFDTQPRRGRRARAASE